MKSKSKIGDKLAILTLSILFIGGGIVMIAKNLIGVGINSRTLHVSAINGYVLVFIGVIFLLVAYYSLSPFGKIRGFIEKAFRRTKKRP